jgi:gas vesicle protein
MQSNYKGIMFAFISGALVGAGVALLTAPASGEETRDRIRKLGREGKDRLARVPGKLSHALGRSKEAAKEAYGDAYATAGIGQTEH